MPVTEPALPETFEAALAELERIVAGLEGGQLPLEEALSAYRRGARLLQFAQGRLQAAQQQVQALEGGLLEPFSAEDAGRTEP